MAGGISLGGTRVKRRGRTRRRIGVNIDTTPLVDIAFLLLTFFMFTTELTQPQVMDMKIPQSNKEVNAPQSVLFQLFVRHDNQLFYKMGNEPALALEVADLKTLAINKNLRAPGEVITSLKVSPQAGYNRLIEIIDELNLAEVEILQRAAEARERKFALVPLTEEDAVEIENLPH